MKKTFVFVVCGSAEHVETLNFSLKALRKFSKNEILVLTDSSRNECEIDHHKIIDIKTPEQYNHHQASIYLKTGIHNFVPRGNSYCYLDTDIVALSSNVDEIFEQRNGTINFASDHCRIKSFSPFAVNCNCEERWKNWTEELDLLLDKYDKSRKIKDERILRKRKELMEKFEKLREKPLRYALISARFLLSPLRFKLDDDTYYNRWKKYWHDADGNVIIYDNEDAFKLIEKKSHFVWNKKKSRWLAEGKHDIYVLECDHLKQQIKSTFGIEVSEPNWQHWNGGVFLFDEKSHSFLQSWHEKTLQIFSDKKWKTRDQGTLIATAWEFGIQNQPLLPVEFNFLADYYHPTMQYKGGFKFYLNKNRPFIKPALLHIYHHWGDKEWQLWRDVERHVLNGAE